MPRQVRDRGAGLLKHRFRVQILATAFELETDSDRMAESLQFILQGAEQVYGIECEAHFLVRKEGAEFVTFLNGSEFHRELASEVLKFVIFGQMRFLALETMGEWIELHAATVEHAGRRAIIVGESGDGKSTIALRAMFAGGAVPGDERILLRRDQSVVYPRRFHVKSSGLWHHPEIEARIDEFPFFTDEDGIHRVFTVAPTDFGLPWKIDVRPIDTVFCIESNRGGQTRSRRIAGLEMAEMLTSKIGPPAGPRSGWVADIAMLVERAECRQLYNGDASQAALEVLRVLENQAAASQP